MFLPFQAEQAIHYSEGCNNLVKKNKAAIIASANDIIYIMAWEAKENKNAMFRRNCLLNFQKMKKNSGSVEWCRPNIC